MRMLRLVFPVVAALIAAGPGAEADDLLPADRPIEGVVDEYLDAKLAREDVRAAAAADDATLVRRLTLDLVGRIPTEGESRAFVDSTDPDKRARLVDRLIASPGFVRHQADAFEAMLMAGVRGSLREYLLAAFRDGRSWDRVFRDLVVGDESEPGRKGAAGFIRPRAKDLDRLTSDVSSLFFGVNVSCAKCHDHPRVKDWKQDHYYGMKSFLGRTFVKGTFIGERDSGEVTFKTTEGEERKAKFMFLTGRVVEIPAAEKSPAEKRPRGDEKGKNTPPAPPKVSARARLVEIALEPGERDFFARSIVNRVWHRIFGVGLVMPLDQMHSENPPSHPELLRWLARDMVEHGYDLRRLTRGLVLSRAYARSSRWESGEAPEPRLFAVAAIRPLSPMQLATSMWVATTDPATFPDDLRPEAIDGKVAPMEARARGLAEAIARPGEDYQIGAAEALLMSNSARLNDLLNESGDRLVGRLLRIKDRHEQVELAVRNIYARPADDEEAALLGAFLAGRPDRPAEACRQLVWSLLTSAEFRFNY
jgi:hypothetical protein